MMKILFLTTSLSKLKILTKWSCQEESDHHFRFAVHKLDVRHPALYVILRQGCMLLSLIWRSILLQRGISRQSWTRCPTQVGMIRYIFTLNACNLVICSSLVVICTHIISTATKVSSWGYRTMLLELCPLVVKSHLTLLRCQSWRLLYSQGTLLRTWLLTSPCLSENWHWQ